MYKICFLIVTYNSSNYIQNTINSINIFEPEKNIVIIDNNSTDNTIDLIKEFRNIIILKNNKNLGFGLANNIGFKYAIDNGYDYVYLLNHDAYLVEPVTKQLCAILNENPFIGIISPFHLEPNLKNIEFQFEKHLLNDKLFSKIYLDILEKKDISSFYSVKFVPAASWLLPISVVNEVGGFLPLFHHYGEDNNYIHRLLYHKYEIAIVPHLRICHVGNSLKKEKHIEFDNYSLNRIKSYYLVSVLDIQRNDEIEKISFEQKKIIKNLFKSIVLFRYKFFLNKMKYFLYVISSKKHIKKYRDYSKNPKYYKRYLFNE